MDDSQRCSLRLVLNEIDRISLVKKETCISTDMMCCLLNFKVCFLYFLLHNVSCNNKTILFDYQVNPQPTSIRYLHNNKCMKLVISTQLGIVLRLGFKETVSVI